MIYISTYLALLIVVIELVVKKPLYVSMERGIGEVKCDGYLFVRPGLTGSMSSSDQGASEIGKGIACKMHCTMPLWQYNLYILVLGPLEKSIPRAGSRKALCRAGLPVG